ncbi:hypothetical protein LIER_19366 [Lithospermum erythrorhizon]|uniref:Uncharacterized protein n=1 Tax=Lithospermum erythrorhizon TaxID=34254 RepID=A0AAV3QKJ2_LITER
MAFSHCLNLPPSPLPQFSPFPPHYFTNLQHCTSISASNTSSASTIPKSPFPHLSQDFTPINSSRRYATKMMKILLCTSLNGLQTSLISPHLCKYTRSFFESLGRLEHLMP